MGHRGRVKSFEHQKGSGGEDGRLCKNGITDKPFCPQDVEAIHSTLSRCWRRIADGEDGDGES